MAFNSRKFAPLMVASAAVALVALAPTSAHAKRKIKSGPLDGEPVVRKKIELRKLRANITPLIGISLSQPFVHMGYAGAKLGFDVTDWIGVRTGFQYGVVPVRSQLLKDLNEGLPVAVQDPMGRAVRADGDLNSPAPLRHDFRAGLTQATWQGSFDVQFTPFAGKMGIFSGIFTEYDLYVFGGLGYMGWTKHYKNARSTAGGFDGTSLDTDPDSPSYCRASAGDNANQECLLHPVQADTGVKLGASFGAGVHVFLSDWLSINMELQDILTRNNLAGLNKTVTDVPPVVNNSDRDAFHNVTFQLGATFYLPFKAKRTD